MSEMKKLSKEQRLKIAPKWLSEFKGKNVARSYKRHFSVSWNTAFEELELLNIKLDVNYKNQVLNSLENKKSFRKEQTSKSNNIKSFFKSINDVAVDVKRDIDQIYSANENLLDDNGFKKLSDKNGAPLKELLNEIKIIQSKFEKSLEKLNQIKESNKGTNLLEQCKFLQNELVTKVENLKIELIRSRLTLGIYKALKQSSSFREKVAQNIFDFIFNLSNEINVSQVVLFGSHASAIANRWSDIDLAIVSEDFEKMSKFTKKSFLRKFACQSNTPSIQAIGYSIAEWFSEQEDDFLQIIKSTCTPIFDNPKKI